MIMRGGSPTMRKTTEPFNWTGSILTQLLRSKNHINLGVEFSTRTRTHARARAHAHAHAHTHSVCERVVEKMSTRQANYEQLQKYCNQRSFCSNFPTS